MSESGEKDFWKIWFFRIFGLGHEAGREINNLNSSYPSNASNEN